MSLIDFKVRLKTRNKNGIHPFNGGEYKLVSIRGNTLASGKTNSQGYTASVRVSRGQKVYVKVKNILTGEWVSTHPINSIYVVADRSVKSVTVKNSYFRIKLETTNNVSLSWYYRMIFKDDRKNEFVVTGELKNGKSGYVNYDSIEKDINKEIFLNKSIGNTQVKTEFKKDRWGKVFSTAYSDLIPCGSDKYYRVHKLALTTSTTDELTADSEAILQEAAIKRKIILDISLSAGATYSIERSDGGQIMDKDLFKSNKILFQDSEKREIRVPKNYYGRLLLKKGSKLIATFPLSRLDPSKKNEPIVFCLSNKSTPVTKQKISVNDIDKTDLMMWHFQTKESLPEGQYEFDRSNKGSISDLKKIANTIFSSIAFDGVVLPTVGEVQNALKANNRRFIYDALKKLKVGDKQDILRFYIKKSKTGANMIVFKGYSGLRSFITGTRYGINNLKVGMIASSSSVYAAASSAGIGSAARTTASTAGKSLGGIGFGIVAFFEVFEWWTTDDPLHNWSDLWIGLGGSAVKAVIATAAGVLVGSLAIAAGLPAIAIIGFGFGAVIGFSFALESADRYFSITDKAKSYSNELGL